MILTEVCLINADKSDIEPILESEFGEILRWAIVDVKKDSYKIAVSYIKKG